MGEAVVIYCFCAAGLPAEAVIVAIEAAVRVIVSTAADYVAGARTAEVPVSGDPDMVGIPVAANPDIAGTGARGNVSDWAYSRCADGYADTHLGGIRLRCAHPEGCRCESCTENQFSAHIFAEEFHNISFHGVKTLPVSASPGL
jgi:hypothetical protein